MRQVVRDGETGRLFETGNQSALTTALGEALADIAGTRRKGVRGAELMRELPVSEDDVSAAFRDAYDLALGRA